MRKKEFVNEKICAIYLLLFTILKVLTTNFGNISTLILTIAMILLYTLSIVYNYKNRKSIYINKKVILLTLLVMLLFTISLLLHSTNKIFYKYLYEFFIYGFSTIYFISYVKDIKKMFLFMAYINIGLIAIYIFDPFNNYYFFGGYMGYGFNLVLPAFFSFSIARNLYKRKLFLVFEVICLIELIVFCNKGAALTALLIEMSIFIYQNRLKPQQILYTSLLFLILFVSIMKFDYILQYIMKLLSKYNVDSYSIKSMHNTINHLSNGLSGRDKIWNIALRMSKENYYFGMGIGTFQMKMGYYTHNIFLEILTNYGIIGIVISTIMLCMYIIKILREKHSKKFLLTVFLIMAIVPLCFSLYTFKWQYFWILLYLLFNNNIINLEGEQENE